ncbi:MAG: hypothetical protein EXX96DRAFT_376730 [Benjaminiella poitrasii]|nr:MAG: hypothetical protein EXX96DRAFT_376730 [Benjaminiella poitrasii]
MSDRRKELLNSVIAASTIMLMIGKLFQRSKTKGVADIALKNGRCGLVHSKRSNGKVYNMEKSKKMDDFSFIYAKQKKYTHHASSIFLFYTALENVSIFLVKKTFLIFQCRKQGLKHDSGF